MLDRFDEHELLALIEDQLDPRAAEKLRQRLEAEPGALAFIERLRHDRDLLREAPQPSLPGDLLAELEPMMARPMLMPETDWRRRHRRRVRVPVRALAAAVVVIAAGGGLWAVVSTVDWAGLVESLRPGDDAPMVAAADSQAPSGSAADGREGADVAEATRAPAAPKARQPRPVDPGPGGLIPAEFVLVVAAKDSSTVEHALRTALDGMQTETALVRNFSSAEAAELERMLLKGSAMDLDGAAPPATVAGMPQRGDAMPGDPQRRQPGPQRSRRRQPKVTVQNLLLGPRELAPSFDDQLEFSGQGAVYTISVPVSMLDDVLVRLQLAGDARTTLQLRRAGTAAAADPKLWLQDYPQVQRAAADLRENHPDAIVLLPVVVK